MSEEKVMKKSEDGAADTRFTELCPSDPTIHPSYAGLLKLPYDVVCRQRLIRKKRRFAVQFNRELDHIIAMQMRAVDGIKLDLLFSIDE